MLTRLKAWWTTFRYRQVSLELLISACLAFLVWLYTYSRAHHTIDHVRLPVQIQLPLDQRDQYVLEVSGQPRVNVSFSGPNSRLRELRRKIQRGGVQAVVNLKVPEDKLNEAMFGDVMRVKPSDIPVPAGVIPEILEEGNNFSVTFHRLVERTLPVRLDYVGEARVSQIKVEPTTVLVRGPKSILDRCSFIPTQPYALPVNPEQTGAQDPLLKDQVTLVTEMEGRPVQASPNVVQFRARVEPRQKIYELNDVPVHFLSPAGFPWKARFLNEFAGKVSVRVIGPASEDVPPVMAYVDLTGGSYARGRNLEPLRVQLPKDFQLVQPAAGLIAFYLDELDRPTTTTTSQPKTE